VTTVLAEKVFRNLILSLSRQHTANKWYLWRMNWVTSVARSGCAGEGGGISSDLKGTATFSRHLAAGSVICTNAVIFCLILLTG
jgi:hypothetical protein